MIKPKPLSKDEWEMLERRPYGSSSEVTTSRKWTVVIASTICLAAVNSLAVWVLIKYGEGYAIFTMLVAVALVDMTSYVDLLGVLNSKRIRSNIKGNIIGYVFLWPFLLLFPAIDPVQGIFHEAARAIALCLAPSPTVVGFLFLLLQEKKNICSVVDAVNQTNRHHDSAATMNDQAEGKSEDSREEVSSPILSVEKRKRTLKRNGWILLLVWVAAIVLANLVGGALWDTLSFLTLVAAICCFVAAALTKTAK